MKILDVCHYYTYPPRAGGQLRIFHLNKEISRCHEVTQLSFTPAFVKPKTLKFGNYEEIIIPGPLYLGLTFVIKRIFRLPFDFIVPFVFKFSKYRRLERYIQMADIIQVEHPWLFYSVYKLARKYKKKIILVEHNVEFQLQDIGIKVLPEFLIKMIMNYIKKIEFFALKNSDYVITTSEEDKSFLIEYFKINENKIRLVTNGVDFNFFNRKEDKVKLNKLKGKTKGKHKHIILFSGAGHPPNYEALYIIEKTISKKLPNCLFLIAGSVHKKGKKGNILYTGPVKNIHPYFHIADIAVNPILHGSGTNLKMLDYMSTGLPVVTTRFGARGFNVENEKECIISELEYFDESIGLILKDSKLHKKLIRKAKRFAKNYDWYKISKSLNKIYNSIT